MNVFGKAAMHRASHLLPASDNAARTREACLKISSSTMHSISWSDLKLGGTTLVSVMVSSRSHRKAVYWCVVSVVVVPVPTKGNVRDRWVSHGFGQK